MVCKWVIYYYNLLINGVYWGYKLLTNLLLASWDIQAWEEGPTSCFFWGPLEKSLTKAVNEFIDATSFPKKITVGGLMVFSQHVFFPYYRWFWRHVLMMHRSFPKIHSLDIQNPPRTWWEGVWNPLKKSSQEMFKGSNLPPQKLFGCRWALGSATPVKSFALRLQN